LRHLGTGATITVSHLSQALVGLQSGEIALLATGWGGRSAHTDEWKHRAPALSLYAVRWLVARQARGVEIDPM
jgi:kynurenine formamidase